MDRCGCDDDGFAAIFDVKTAERDRERYRRDGPDRTTRMLIELLEREGLEGEGLDGATLLDVGGGTGIVDRELLARGVARATLVDGSPAYLRVAREEADAAGVGGRLEIVAGDFVARAADIGPADVVTLDRVICCYPQMRALVSGSARRARRLYGIVLPRDRWPVRVMLALESLWFRLRRSTYRPYGHSNRAVDAVVAAEGLRPVAETGTFTWRVVVYRREADPAPSA